jgi:hypothetical protein
LAGRADLADRFQATSVAGAGPALSARALRPFLCSRSCLLRNCRLLVLTP